MAFIVTFRTKHLTNSKVKLKPPSVQREEDRNHETNAADVSFYFL